MGFKKKKKKRKGVPHISCSQTLAEGLLVLFMFLIIFDLYFKDDRSRISKDAVFF